MIFRVVQPKSNDSPTRTLGSAELVRWGHPAAPRPHTIIVLADGGQIVTAADWSGGTAVRLEDDTAVVLSDTLGEFRVPRALISGVVFALQSHADERAQLAEQVRGEFFSDLLVNANKNEDVVLLTNLDRITGRLTELTRGSLTITAQDGDVKLPLSRIRAITFGDRQSPAVSPRAKLIVALRDGSLLYVDRLEKSDAGLAMNMGELTINAGNLTDIVALQSLGGSFEYLSNLEPADYRHVPYLDIPWNFKRDHNVLGEPLKVDGKRYLEGIGMHSASRLTYKLDGRYDRFDAEVAVDGSAGQRGSVTFGVYTIREGKLQEAFKSGIVRGGEAPRTVSVDVGGAEALTLIVDYADRGDEMDRADWLDARLVKKK